MACIQYQYQPALHDLFLYNDDEFVWSGGSAFIKRPYDWNPSSLLYGYRKSLEGISARPRTLSTTASAPVVSYYSAYNDPNLIANYPAFRNSFPPSHALINEKFFLACKHCFGFPGGARNPSQMIGGAHYPLNSYLQVISYIEFIKFDGTAYAVGSQNAIIPYDTDPDFPTFRMDRGFDVCLGEFAPGFELPQIQPIVFADPRTVVPDSVAWYIDGSDKILRGRLRMAWIDSRYGSEQFWFEATNPDGSTTGLPAAAYTHDSGSKFFVEIKPPRDWNAGDGVLGMIPTHMFGAEEISVGRTRSDISGGATSSGYSIIDAEGMQSLIARGLPGANEYKNSNLAAYMAHRGYSISIQHANRIGDTASETIESQVLSKALECLVNLSSTQDEDDDYGTFFFPKAGSSDFGTFSAPNGAKDYGTF